MSNLLYYLVTTALRLNEVKTLKNMYVRFKINTMANKFAHIAYGGIVSRQTKKQIINKIWKPGINYSSRYSKELIFYYAICIHGGLWPNCQKYR